MIENAEAINDFLPIRRYFGEILSKSDTLNYSFLNVCSLKEMNWINE